MTSAIARLNDFGQSPWYDNLTRVMATGGLRTLVDDDGIRGVTSNPTIFEKAMASGEGYDEQLRTLRADGADLETTYWELVLADIADAADLLRPVHDSLGGHDGFVSVEVSPLVAADPAATIEQANWLFGRLARPNVFVKIPATEAGIPAITATIAQGLNINITLIFSLERYEQVIEAYLQGLEQRVAKGEPIDHIHSVASFFVSRVDTETDRRLAEESPLRGRAAVANAKLAYERFLQRFSGARWEALAAKGATLQRPLWASTSTKNPAYSPTLYVDTLIGRDTVNTLAPASIDALHEGDVDLHADSVLEDVDAAHALMDELAAAGIDFDDVTRTLERDGVDAFAQSYRDCLDSLDKRGAELLASA